MLEQWRANRDLKASLESLPGELQDLTDPQLVEEFRKFKQDDWSRQKSGESSQQSEEYLEIFRAEAIKRRLNLDTGIKE